MEECALEGDDFATSHTWRCHGWPRLWDRELLQIPWKFRKQKQELGEDLGEISGKKKKNTTTTIIIIIIINDSRPLNKDIYFFFLEKSIINKCNLEVKKVLVCIY